MKLSVIIPVYNAEEYLVECLDSVICIKDIELEIICVNDGSTDGSLEILKDYEDKFANIIIIDGENQGVAVARNKGIRKASGDYITFLDSDDMFIQENLNKLLSKCYENNLDIIYFDFKNFSQTADLRERFNKKYEERIRVGSYDEDQVFTGMEIMERFIENRDYILVAYGGLFRRSFILENEIFFEEGFFYEDAPFALLLMLNAERVACSNHIGYDRRVRVGSIEHSKMTAKHLYGYMRGFLYMYEYLNEYKEKWQHMPHICENVMSRKLHGIIKMYNAVDPEEYEEFKSMCTPEQLMFFEMMIKRRADRVNKKDKLIGRYKRENEKLKTKIEKMAESHQFRIGGIILWPLRKLRRLIKRK